MTTWPVIAACAVVLLLPVAWRIRWRRFDPFEPIVLFAIAYGAMFVVRPASIEIEGDSRFWGIDVLPTLPHSLVIALVGAVGFVVGYELRTSRRLAVKLPKPRPVDPVVATVSALLVATVALLALAIFLPLSEGVDAIRILLSGRSTDLGDLLRDSSTYVWYGSLLFAPAAFVLAGLALRHRTAPLLVAAAIVLLLAFARVVPIGGRIVLLPLIGGFFVLAYTIRGRRPRPLTLAAITAVALVGSYLTLHLRDPTDDLTLRTAIEQLGDRPQAVFDPVLHGADAEMVLALSAALTVIPDELSYRWGGATIGNLVTRPVPRELWPDKPRPPGEDVVATVWPQFYPGLDPAFSPLLVFYWDLWLVGVLLGMAVFGLFARVLYEWFVLHRDAFAAQLVYATAVWFVVIGARNDPVDTIVLAAFLLAPVVAIAALAGNDVLPETVQSRILGRLDAERATAHEHREPS